MEYVINVSHKKNQKWLNAPKQHLLVSNARRFPIGRYTSQRPEAIILIMDIISHLLQILQVRTQNHIPERDKITMMQIFN